MFSSIEVVNDTEEISERFTSVSFRRLAGVFRLNASRWSVDWKRNVSHCITAIIVQLTLFLFGPNDSIEVNSYTEGNS